MFYPLSFACLILAKGCVLDRIVAFIERVVVLRLRPRIKRGRHAFTALVSIGCMAQTASSLQGTSYKACLACSFCCCFTSSIQYLVCSLCDTAVSAAAANARASVIEGTIPALIAANSSNVAASVADADAAASAAQIGRLVSSSSEAIVSALMISTFIAVAVPFFVYVKIMMKRLGESKSHFLRAEEVSIPMPTSRQQQRNAVAARIIDKASAEQEQLKRKVPPRALYFVLHSL